MMSHIPVLSRIPPTKLSISRSRRSVFILHPKFLVSHIQPRFLASSRIPPNQCCTLKKRLLKRLVDLLKYLPLDLPFVRFAAVAIRFASIIFETLYVLQTFRKLPCWDCCGWPKSCFSDYSNIKCFLL